jgi:hypothetical protein
LGVAWAPAAGVVLPPCRAQASRADSSATEAVNRQIRIIDSPADTPAFPGRIPVLPRKLHRMLKQKTMDHQREEIGT